VLCYVLAEAQPGSSAMGTSTVLCVCTEALAPVAGAVPTEPDADYDAHFTAVYTSFERRMDVLLRCKLQLHVFGRADAAADTVLSENVDQCREIVQLMNSHVQEIEDERTRGSAEVHISPAVEASVAAFAAAATAAAGVIIAAATAANSATAAGQAVIDVCDDDDTTAASTTAAAAAMDVDGTSSVQQDAAAAAARSSDLMLYQLRQEIPCMPDSDAETDDDDTAANARTATSHGCTPEQQQLIIKYLGVSATLNTCIYVYKYAATSTVMLVSL
jgi:hypothetical protein